jgi:hypothetical protein
MRKKRKVNTEIRRRRRRECEGSVAFACAPRRGGHRGGGGHRTPFAAQGEDDKVGVGVHGETPKGSVKREEMRGKMGGMRTARTSPRNSGCCCCSSSSSSCLATAPSSAAPVNDGSGCPSPLRTAWCEMLLSVPEAIRVVPETGGLPFPGQRGETTLRALPTDQEEKMDATQL